MIRLNRACVACVALGVLALTHLAAQAGGGRSIRVDVGDSNFDTNGESWTGSHELDFSVQTQAFGAIPFNLNFSGAAGPGGHYSYNFSGAPAWDAFLDLSDPSTGINGTIFPYYSWVDTVSWSSGEWSVGVIDTEGPYLKSEAVDAIRFTWQGKLSAGGFVAAQVVFLDRSSGGAQGDFDIELNYGFGSFNFPAGGAQQLTLGPQTFYGGIVSDPLTNLCFRDGVGADCATGVVPEPSSYALFALGLAVLGVPVLRRRQRSANV